MPTLEVALRERENLLLAEMCDFIVMEKGQMDPASDRYLLASKLTARYDELEALRNA